jgi:hypothetical protein
MWETRRKLVLNMKGNISSDTRTGWEVDIEIYFAEIKLKFGTAFKYCRIGSTVGAL